MKTDGRRYYKSKTRREIAKVYLRTSTVNLRLELFSLASRSFVSIRGLENSFPLNEISQPHIVHYRFYLPDQLHGQSSRPHSDFWLIAKANNNPVFQVVKVSSEAEAKKLTA